MGYASAQPNPYCIPLPHNQANRGQAEQRVGYLVANPHPDRAHHLLVHPKIDHQKLSNTSTACCQAWALAIWNRVWTFAQELQERFGVKHMLLGPPQLATLPEEQAARLNKNLTAVFPMVDGRAHPLARYPAGEEVTVQAVRECTWPSCIMVGCRSEKLPSFTGGALLEGFIAHARHGAVQSSTNATMLVQRMKQSFALVEATVKAHPCLKLDFQVFLRSDGGVFNIDLDRCFKKERSKTAGPIEDEISPLDIIKLPEPSRRDWSPGGQPGRQLFCRRGSEQRILIKALDHLFRRLNGQTL